MGPGRVLYRDQYPVPYFFRRELVPVFFLINGQCIRNDTKNRGHGDFRSHPHLIAACVIFLDRIIKNAGCPKARKNAPNRLLSEALVLVTFAKSWSEYRYQPPVTRISRQQTSLAECSLGTNHE